MKCEPVVFSLGEKRWSRESLISWLFEYTDNVYRSEAQSRVIFAVKEIRKNCTENVLSPKFVRGLPWGAWAEINDEEQVGNLSTLLLPPRSHLAIPFWHLLCCFTFFRDFLLQWRSWKAEFVMSECNRAVAFLLLKEKVRSCWVLHPFGWESGFSEKAAEQYSCLW